MLSGTEHLFSEWHLMSELLALACSFCQRPDSEFSIWPQAEVLCVTMSHVVGKKFESLIGTVWIQTLIPPLSPHEGCVCHQVVVRCTV